MFQDPREWVWLTQAGTVPAPTSMSLSLATKQPLYHQIVVPGTWSSRAWGDSNVQLGFRTTALVPIFICISEGSPNPEQDHLQLVQAPRLHSRTRAFRLLFLPTLWRWQSWLPACGGGHVTSCFLPIHPFNEHLLCAKKSNHRLFPVL